MRLMKAATDLQEQAIEEISKDIEDLLLMLSMDNSGICVKKSLPLPLLMVYITERWMMLFAFYRTSAITYHCKTETTSHQTRS
ncbi:hypothetical protein ACEQPO_07060 [Bacillus sp. SL00103]